MERFHVQVLDFSQPPHPPPHALPLAASIPGERQLTPAVPRGSLTHNPPLLRYAESSERDVNPLHTPKSAGSYLHRDIKETEGGAARGLIGCTSTAILQYPVSCLLNSSPSSHLFPLSFFSAVFPKRTTVPPPESFLRMLVLASGQ